MQKLLTIKMASALLNRSYNTTARWISEGLFPNASKIKNGWFIPEGDIRRLLRAGRTHAAGWRLAVIGSWTRLYPVVNVRG
jgi:predicted site-specific integrase-resolvase